MLASLRTSVSVFNPPPEPAKIITYNAQTRAQIETISCKYRPTQISLSKGASFGAASTGGTTSGSQTQENNKPRPTLNVPQTQYTGSSAATLKLDLFFDTTDTGESVLTYTKKVLQLVRKIDGDPEKTQPPLCRFQWGNMMTFLACVTSVSVTYTFFKGDGTPLRADVSISLQEYEDGQLYEPQNPTSRSDARKTWVVLEGQRLDWIAYQEYGASRYWRHIAEVNGLQDPSDIYPGKILKLTPLPPED